MLRTAPLPSPDHEAKCKSLYRGLLDCVSGRRPFQYDIDYPNALYVRVFNATEGCDDVHDFRPAREELRMHMEDRTPGFSSRTPAPEDEIFAADAVRLFRREHQQQLLKSLGRKDRVRWHTIDRIEIALSALLFKSIRK